MEIGNIIRITGYAYYETNIMKVQKIFPR